MLATEPSSLWVNNGTANVEMRHPSQVEGAKVKVNSSFVIY